MIENLGIVLQQRVGKNSNVIVLQSEENDFRSIYRISRDQLEHDSHILSPLKDAVSAPMRFRSIHYRHVFTDEKGGLSSRVDSILRAGHKIVEDDVGKFKADEWSILMKSIMQSNISAGRTQDILESENGFIDSKSKTKGHKVKEELLFRIHENQQRIIADREYSRGRGESPPQGLDGYRVIGEKFQHLLDELVQFETYLKAGARSNHHHHLFIWSDSKSTNFPPSFLEDVIELYLQDSTPHSSQSAHILILASFGDNPLEGILKTLHPIEKLAMQRGDYSGSWMMTSSSSNAVNNYQLRCKERLIELGLDVDNLIGINWVQHECQDQQLEHGSVAIFLSCGVHSWLHSREIDGEQVMTN